MDLKPCPFCGGYPIEYEIEAHKHFISNMPDYGGGYVIECCVGFVCDTKGEAIRRWNTRVPETKVTSAGEITEDGILRNEPWNG